MTRLINDADQHAYQPEPQPQPCSQPECLSEWILQQVLLADPDHPDVGILILVHGKGPVEIHPNHLTVLLNHNYVCGKAVITRGNYRTLADLSSLALVCGVVRLVDREILPSVFSRPLKGKQGVSTTGQDFGPTHLKGNSGKDETDRSLGPRYYDLVLDRGPLVVRADVVGDLSVVDHEYTLPP